MIDDSEYERAEKIFGHEMKAAEMVAKLLNPELIFASTRVASVIDLRKKYDIATTHRPWLRDKGQHFECFDRVTFDHDPEGRWHIFGHGESGTEALADLLSNLAEEAAKG